MQAERKIRVLLVGQGTSVHFARWLKSIDTSKIEGSIYSSGGNRWIHQELEQFLASETGKAFTISQRQRSRDYWLAKLERIIGVPIFRSLLLKRIAGNNRFDLIHFFDFQNSAYLLLPYRRSWANLKVPIITSNWGSDLAWYAQYESHKKKLRKCLQLASVYTAECNRDLELSSSFGFSGQKHLILNGGGVEVEIPEATKDRRVIVVKGYEDTFGQAQVILNLVAQNPEVFSGYRLLVLSAAKSLIPFLEDLKSKIAPDVEVEYDSYATNRYPRSQEELRRVLRNSKILVSMSRCDGVATLALEALSVGCLPIQSPTACLEDYLTQDTKNFQPKENTASEFLRVIRIALSHPSNSLVTFCSEAASAASDKISREVTSRKINDLYLQSSKLPSQATS